MAGSIGSGIPTTRTDPGAAITKATQSLGKDEFLKLLLTELRYQDAMDPMKDKEFIAQMAQFSSVEQMVNLTNSFTAFAAESKRGAALELLGRRVTSINPDTGEEVSGVAASVKFEKNDPEIRLQTEAGLTKVVKLSSVTSAETVS